MQFKACTNSSRCGECAPRDCDLDNQCKRGLLCADAHKAELTASGYDPRKSYCGNLGERNWELCYDPKKISSTSKCTVDTDCKSTTTNLCTGAQKCVAGSCVTGTPLDCDDKNACTTDTCDPIKGCVHTPLACGKNKACDKITGTCVAIDKLRPCIAVIDESDNFFDSEIDTKWAAFRANFPDRFFCLLQPLEPSYSRIYFPTKPDFLSDPRVTFAQVKRDNGNAALASDWLTACGYDDFSTNGIDFIGLFVDESGSMTRSTVQASLAKLDVDLAAAKLTYCSVFNGSEDWITPFDTALGTVGGGGACSVVP
jgi:Dictyostelium (slime mold) repeat